jgi:methyl-accepting chemotaxis protein
MAKMTKPKNKRMKAVEDNFDENHTTGRTQARSSARTGDSGLYDLLDALDSVRKGDLSVKMKRQSGVLGEISDSYNEMVDRLRVFASEVTRVAGEVGTDGKLGGQAKVEDVSGVWKDLTNNVNLMANNLTEQVRDIAKVSTAVANGDLSQKITVEVKGEILELKNILNKMIDQLGSFAGEVTRVAMEVGTAGQLGGQAKVEGVSGTWKDLTENVNTMASNLTNQVRDIANVATAVANGDLSQKITVDVKGEVLELKNTLNEMVDKLNAFGGEVTRVAREVGTEGKLGGQAIVEGVSGTWKDLTENVNTMANNLTSQVRDIAQVTTAVAKGDLGQKITVDVKGEVQDLKNTINTMVDQLQAFAGEVTRVALEVGTEGKLGGQAKVEGVSGTWKDLTDNVNAMANNLTSQVRDIASVTTAVAKGDLGQKISVDVKGEVQDLKNTINTMVDQLKSFAGEVTRVALEVGTEGKLGGQAKVEGVSGTWKDLTDNVNAMASNLTSQVRDIAQVTTAVAKGNLNQKITVDVKGEVQDLKNTINTMVDQLQAFAGEVTRVALEVGTEGMLGGQAEVEGVSGTWKELTDNVNAMASNLTSQVRDIAQVTTGVANGDLRRKITVEVKGEVLELKNTINEMIDRLSSFAGEVTRVAREVGTEGMLGGQAKVEGVSGTWKDLTDNVNTMAGNLTNQVRDIANVATAVANGDLGQKISVDVKGEVLELKNTLNQMVDKLNAFGGEVTRVAREVGTEGKLGGQAKVEGVSGTWKDLTDNVNTMAGNLTTQVRAIITVSKAMADGDLTQKINLEAKGEVLDLVNTLNDMIDRLNDSLALIQDSAQQVARSNSEVASGAEQISKGSAQQAKQAVETASAMEELFQAIKVVSDNATKMQTAAEKSLGVTAEGDKLGEQNLQGQNKTKDIISTATQGIEELTKRSQEIGAVVTTINGIASQTNLLALNAAIEAAGAGEAGKRFDVVAEEVRKLAERAAGATREAQEMVESIQKETGAVKDSMTQGMKEVEAGTELTGKTREALVAIRREMENVGELIKAAASSAEQQTKTSEMVSANIEGINKSTQQTAAITEQAAKGSENVTNLAETMLSNVAFFKLAARAMGIGGGSRSGGEKEGPKIVAKSKKAA